MNNKTISRSIWLRTVASGALVLLLNQSVWASLSASPARKPAAAATQPAKADVVQKLRNLQISLTQEIGSLENSSKRRLRESTSISLKEPANLTERKITRLAEQITDIEKKRTETLARRDFVDQLLLQVDAKWNGQNLQKFLEAALLDMSVIELTHPQGGGELWRFYTFLSIAIREIPSGNDDILGILEDYMNFASVLNPKTPAEYLAGRDYTNTSSSATANPVNRENLSQGLEDKLKQFGEPALSKPAQASGPKADIELRLKAPTDPRPALAPALPPPTSTPAAPPDTLNHHSL